MKEIKTTLAFCALVLVLIFTVIGWYDYQYNNQTKELRSAATTTVVVEKYDTVYDIMRRALGHRVDDFSRDVMHEEFARLNGGKKAIDTGDTGHVVRVPNIQKINQNIAENIAAAQ